MNQVLLYNYQTVMQLTQVIAMALPNAPAMPPIPAPILLLEDNMESNNSLKSESINCENSSNDGKDTSNCSNQHKGHSRGKPKDDWLYEDVGDGNGNGANQHKRHRRGKPKDNQLYKDDDNGNGYGGN